MQKPFEIIFEDEYIIVLNKIAKILVQPSPKNETHTLTSLLGAYLGRKAYPCHRLDRETTGLIVYAKNLSVQDAVMAQFKQSLVRKKYIAFVKGSLRKKTGVFRGYIIDREGARFGEKPKIAKTLYRVLKILDNFSLIELEPLTGRTNQLRIQLANVGNPILGERKYARGKDFKVRFRRLSLHAYYLSFIHPTRKERISFKLDIPLDMKLFLERYSQATEHDSFSQAIQ